MKLVMALLVRDEADIVSSAVDFDLDDERTSLSPRRIRRSTAPPTEAYDAWARFVQPGGVIALHNSRPENPVPDHDGHRWLVEEKITAPYFESVRLVRTTTFAIKC